MVSFAHQQSKRLRNYKILAWNSNSVVFKVFFTAAHCSSSLYLNHPHITKQM